MFDLLINSRLLNLSPYRLHKKQNLNLYIPIIRKTTVEESQKQNNIKSPTSISIKQEKTKKNPAV